MHTTLEQVLCTSSASAIYTTQHALVCDLWSVFVIVQKLCIWPRKWGIWLRPVYTVFCDFRFDFLLLMDVKEWISHKCSGVCNLITASLSKLLLHIIEKAKIAPKIAAKIACVNGPLESLNCMWLIIWCEVCEVSKQNTIPRFLC